MSESTAKTHLSIDDVEHVAALARLGLTAEEKQRMREQLSSILDHISALNRLDTAAIPPTAQVIELANVMREDEVRPSLPREAILRNAPRTEDGFIAVQAVLGGAGGESDA
jgi:aspartyl-tRNA(Asn)/glutamyl-tRNA(Gln) amidotransferase subunit C